MLKVAEVQKDRTLSCLGLGASSPPLHSLGEGGWALATGVLEESFKTVFYLKLKRKELVLKRH